MLTLFDLPDTAAANKMLRPDLDFIAMIGRHHAHAKAEGMAVADTFGILVAALAHHSARIHQTHSARLADFVRKVETLLPELAAAREHGRIGDDAGHYARDLAERLVLATDILRKRGDVFLEHEAAGCPPVLVYDYEVVMDGRDQPYPSNYMLLRIKPPADVTVDDRRRPYVIIDPRAGHGPGIGGFKADSQVGVALREGHPVYFVAFRREPEPGQCLSSVTRTEAAFVREVMRRHPASSRPVVIGNCQGGWATLLLAALNPDLTGPIVINGAPVAPWSGRVGENPMRYNGGVFGGTWLPMFLSDLGGGLFDGAHLVQNFEMLNPGRTLFRKYTDLVRDADHTEASFLEFERWWGGFFLFNEPEIRWITEQLFVGNRLVKNEARMEPGRPVDLKAIRAPIIVFASHGDNITPPQQALNWIVETYADPQEIRIRGQRIIYMVHHEIGHLGIFVSSRIATREHSQVGSTLKTIEALAPGLYEMRIQDVREEDGHKHFTVDFVERTFDDIRALDDGRQDERPFAAVARASELQAKAYDAMIRPLVRATVTETAAELGRAWHPQRLSRTLMSSKNPAMMAVVQAAEAVRARRAKADVANPFLAVEALFVAGAEQMIDFWRDNRDMAVELAFHTMWGQPVAREFGRSHEARRSMKNNEELRSLPEVAKALSGMESGGFAEAVIRMLVLMAEDRGEVRRDRLERSLKVLTEDEPFRSLGADGRSAVIHEQTLIATYESLRAIETLPALLKDEEERRLALTVVRYIPGPMIEMSPRTIQLIRHFAAVLGQPEPTDDVDEDPLAGRASDGATAVSPSLAVMNEPMEGMKGDAATEPFLAVTDEMDPSPPQGMPAASQSRVKRSVRAARTAKREP